MARGEVGELFSRGPMMFTEYFKDRERTAASFAGDYFSAGDMARQDEDGYYYLVDRKHNMIITGGEKVFPSEVEELISRLPGVFDVAVIGVPHDKWGEMVVAVVVRKQGAALADEDVVAHCKKSVAGYKVPSGWSSSPMRTCPARRRARSSIASSASATGAGTGRPAEAGGAGLARTRARRYRNGRKAGKRNARSDKIARGLGGPGRPGAPRARDTRRRRLPRDLRRGLDPPACAGRGREAAGDAGRDATAAAVDGAAGSKATTTGAPKAGPGCPARTSGRAPGTSGWRRPYQDGRGARRPLTSRATGARPRPAPPRCARRAAGRTVRAARSSLRRSSRSGLRSRRHRRTTAAVASRPASPAASRPRPAHAGGSGRDVGHAAAGDGECREREVRQDDPGRPDREQSCLTGHFVSPPSARSCSAARGSAQALLPASAGRPATRSRSARGACDGGICPVGVRGMSASGTKTTRFGT